jgi:hypothetical protein
LVAVAFDPEPGLAERYGERLIDGPAGHAAMLGIAALAVALKGLGVDEAADAVGAEEHAGILPRRSGSSVDAT